MATVRAYEIIATAFGAHQTGKRIECKKLSPTRAYEIRKLDVVTMGNKYVVQVGEVTPAGDRSKLETHKVRGLMDAAALIPTLRRRYSEK